MGFILSFLLSTTCFGHTVENHQVERHRYKRKSATEDAPTPYHLQLNFMAFWILVQILLKSYTDFYVSFVPFYHSSFGNNI